MKETCVTLLVLITEKKCQFFGGDALSGNVMIQV